MDGSGLIRQIVAKAWSASHYSRWDELVGDRQRDAALRENFRKLCLAHSESNPSARWTDFVDGDDVVQLQTEHQTRADYHMIDTLEEDFHKSQAAVCSWLPLALPGHQSIKTGPLLPSPQLTVEGLTQQGYQVHQLIVSHTGTVSSLATRDTDVLLPPQFGQAFDVRAKMPIN
jgi:hypothetical protein